MNFDYANKWLITATVITLRFMQIQVVRAILKLTLGWNMSKLVRTMNNIGLVLSFSSTAQTLISKH